MVEEPTTQQIVSACYSYRHDYGLLSLEEQKRIASEALQWWQAIAKEVNQPSTHPLVISTADKLIG